MVRELGMSQTKRNCIFLVCDHHYLYVWLIKLPSFLCKAALEHAQQDTDPE